MGTRPSVGILYPYITRDDEQRPFPLSTKPFRQPPHPALTLNALDRKRAFITLPMFAHVEPVGLLLSQLTRFSLADPRKTCRWL